MIITGSRLVLASMAEVRETNPLFRQTREIRHYVTGVHISCYSDVVSPFFIQSNQSAQSLIHCGIAAAWVLVSPRELLIQIEIWLRRKKAACKRHACCIYTALVLFWWDPTPHSGGVCILRHTHTHASSQQESRGSKCHQRCDRLSLTPLETPSAGGPVLTHTRARGRC